MSPWFKIDDSFYDHPKVFDAPDCAVALWTRAGTWSARNLTEGFVPSSLPARLCGDPDTAVKELVRRGLWSRTPGGYQFHDWAKYQPSRASVEDLRAKRAAAGKLGGQARAAKANGKQVPSTSQASASPVGKQNAAPTRPDLKEEVQNHSSPPTADDDPRFLEFWEVYPRKVGKPAARKAWRAAMKRKADPDAIIRAAKAYREDPQRKPDYTKHPGPWLNDERYNDTGRAEPTTTSGGWWNN